MTSRIPDERKQASLKHILIGTVLVIAGVAFLFNAEKWFPWMDYGMIYTISIILTLVGILIMFLSDGHMSEYYSKGGRCTLSNRWKCNGDCRRCIFAQVYLQQVMPAYRQQIQDHSEKPKDGDPGLSELINRYEKK